MANVGKIKQIIGAVVDVHFTGNNKLPEILHALEITRPNGEKLILETQRALDRPLIDHPQGWHRADRGKLHGADFHEAVAFPGKHRGERLARREKPEFRVFRDLAVRHGDEFVRAG